MLSLQWLKRSRASEVKVGDQDAVAKTDSILAPRFESTGHVASCTALPIRSSLILGCLCMVELEQMSSLTGQSDLNAHSSVIAYRAK